MWSLCQFKPALYAILPGLKPFQVLQDQAIHAVCHVFFPFWVVMPMLGAVKNCFFTVPDTSDTFGKKQTYQLQPAPALACTLDTSDTLQNKNPFQKSFLPVQSCCFQLDYSATSCQLVQVIGPCLHHGCPVFHVLGAVVRPAIGIFHSVCQLRLDYQRVKFQHFSQ